MVRAAPWSKSIGEAAEVLLVDGVQHLDDGTLEDLVLQGSDAERPPPSVRLGDVHPPRGLRSVGAGVHTAEKVFEVLSKVLAVGIPRHLVHSWSRFGLVAT
jgi:hypothetical protein